VYLNLYLKNSKLHRNNKKNNNQRLDLKIDLIQQIIFNKNYRLLKRKNKNLLVDQIVIKVESLIQLVVVFMKKIVLAV